MPSRAGAEEHILADAGFHSVDNVEAGEDVVEQVVVGLDAFFVESEGPHVVDDVGNDHHGAHVLGDATHCDAEGVVVDVGQDAGDFCDVESGEVDDDD